MQRLAVTIALLASVLGLSDPVHAAIVTPAGLTGGQQFRLAFVSSQTRDAMSANIVDYDQFIQNLGDAAGLGTYAGQSVSWQVIASTSTVDANDPGRLPPTETIPIYLRSGLPLVDGGAADLWDLGPGTMRIDRPFDVDEFGVSVAPGLVWTGTNIDGNATIGQELGNNGPQGVTIGRTDTDANPWINFGQHLSSDQRLLFGISEVLTVPAVPEPSTFSLAMLGLLALGMRQRLRRR